MGRIDSLILDNFKSYAGKQVIGPFKSFTAVIGPNGAGKSNLMDAICFVVGLSARSLRGDKLLDLVYGHGSERKAKTASVTLKYITSADEVEGYDEGESMTFTRMITASGASVYKVNNEEMTFDEYTEALTAINIVTRARNFLVFQGDVESVAQKNAKEMMNHFEVFSGSDQLREDFDLALKSMHDWRTELANKAARRRVTAQERKAVKAEKDEADRYAALVRQRDEMKIQLALFKLYCVEQRILAEDENRLAAMERLEEASAKEAEAASSLQESAKLLSRLQKEVTAKEKSVAQAERSALKASSTADELAARIGNASVRCDELASKVRSRRKEAEQREKEILALTAEVETLESKLERFESTKVTSHAAGSKGTAALDAEHRAQYNKLKGHMLQKSADIKAKLETLRRDQAADEAIFSGGQGTVDSLEARKADLLAKLEQLRGRKVELENAQVRAVASRKDKERELAEARLQLLEVQKRYEDISTELLEVKNVIAAHKESRVRSENERRVEQAVEDLKRLFPGVRGRLVDLVTPTNKSVKTAVSIALGKHIDSIVVNSESVAFDCIAWLRAEKIRPMTFLPLDTLRSKDFDDATLTIIRSYKSRSGAPVYRIAKDCIKYDPELDVALSYACGSAVIADTLHDAKELRYRRQVFVKVISLDGSVIAKNGNMTGGSSAADRDLERASKWDEKELRSAQSKRDELLTEEELLKRKVSKARTAASESLYVLIEDMESSLHTHNMRLSALVQEIEALTAKMKPITAEIAAVEKQLLEHSPEHDAAKARMEKRAAEMKALEDKISAVQNDVFRDFAASLGLEDMRDYETQIVAKHESDMKAKKEISEALSRLRSKLEYEKERQSNNSAQAAEEELAIEKAALVEMKEKEREAKRAAEEAKKVVETIHEDLSKIRRSLKDAEGSKEASLREKRAAAETKSSATKHIASVEASIERLQAQRHDVLSKAQMEEVQLPTKTSASRRQSRSSRRTEEESADSTPLFSQTMSISSAGGDAGEFAEEDQRRANRIDFDVLDEDLKEQVDAKEDEVAAKLERKVHDLDVQMSKHSPNMKAAAQLAEIDAKLKQETDEYEDCRVKCAEAETAFRKTKNERTKRFMAAFEHATKVIDIIYKELTKSSIHPMGGKASLSLTHDEDIFEQEECGIKFDVMPPGKRFRELESLSGGEKTFAALALIFSLQSYRPSPFFVMDEIDAALDNNNVLKVANYIRRRTAVEVDGEDPSMQAIVISLKDSFYDKAGALVGIYRDAAVNCSRSLTLDLANLSLGGT